MNAQLHAPLPHPGTAIDLHSLWSHLEKPITGLLLTVALGLTVATRPAHSSVPQKADGMRTVASANSMPDGVYLYGQSAIADQIGAAYMVFEVTDQQVVGALYMPQSSFDCFHGQINADQLALTVVNSYEQTSYPYSVALQVNDTVATSRGTGATTVTLDGYQPIQSVSDTNYQILAMCQ